MNRQRDMRKLPAKVEAAWPEAVSSKHQPAQDGDTVAEGETNGGNGCDGQEDDGAGQHCQGRKEGNSRNKAHCNKKPHSCSHGQDHKEVVGLNATSTLAPFGHVICPRNWFYMRPGEGLVYTINTSFSRLLSKQVLTICISLAHLVHLLRIDGERNPKSGNIWTHGYDSMRQPQDWGRNGMKWSCIHASVL